MPPDAAPRPSSKDVAVVGADGRVRLYAPKDVDAALETGGELATPEEVHGAELEERYGGATGALGAGAAGFARGATFGLSDPLAVAVGGEGAREQLRGWKEANPVASGAGELAGVVAPTLLSGGAGALGAGARAVSAPVRGAAALGGLAERGVARVVGKEAAGVGARMLQRGAATGAQGAVEGALYGVGNEISEATIQDHELTAERLLAGAKGGALYGALAGGLLGAGGVAVKAGARKVAEGLTAATEGATGSSLSAWLRRQSEEQAFKSLGSKLPDYMRLGRTAEEQAARAREIGRTALDEGIVSATSSKADMAAALRTRTREVGEELGAMRARLDEAEARPDMARIGKRVNDEIFVPLSRLPGTTKESDALFTYFEDLQLKYPAGPNFEELHTIRKGLDDKLEGYYAKSKLQPRDPVLDNLAKVRRIFEDEYTVAGERAAKELGTTFAENYQATKRLYGNLAAAQKIATKESAREAANRAVSLTDTIAASAGLAGGLTHGPLGAIAGVAVGGANKIMRTYANQAIADLLDRATTIGAVQRASTSTADRLQAGIAGYLKAAKAAAGPIKAAARAAAQHEQARRQTTRAEVDHVTGALSAYQANPGALQEHLARGTQELGRFAPSIASQVGMKAMAATDFLVGKMPPRAGAHADAMSLTPLLTQRATPKGLDPDDFKFLRYVRAAEDPYSVIDDMARGKLSLEGVEALRAIYPKLYASMRSAVFEALANRDPNDGPVDEARAVQLGLLLDLPTHYTLDPAFVAAVQATKAPEPPVQNAGAPPPATGKKSARAMSFGADEMKTPAEEIESL